MATLTEDMKRVVREQRLGYVATVCPDGTPNLSPKGTTRVWDDNHLVFADIRSPRTVANFLPPLANHRNGMSLSVLLIAYEMGRQPFVLQPSVIIEDILD
jgi:predicted pyridoxine 5'-phosphate oxidase superfamily flavin-nucleotide-binding protein